MKKILVLLISAVTALSLFSAPTMERYLAPSARYGTDSASSAAQAATLSEMMYALGNLYTYLDSNFLYEIDTQKMQNQVISAMIDSLGDKYSYYVPPEKAQEAQEETSGRYVGVGMYLTKVNPAYIDWNDPSTYMVVITTPFSGGPADRAGIRAGDMISHVDGEAIYELDATAASRRIRGKEGVPITLTVHRGESEFDVTLIPEQIITPSTERILLDGDVGYIRILEFSASTAESFKKDVASLLSDGAECFIIDLRNNGGGSVDSSLSIANMFVPGGNVLMTTKFKEGSNNKDTVYYSTDYTAVPEDMPLVVLVNGGTASSSEILTGALKDNGRATVVGSKTFGKGIMQYMLSFMGGYLNLTVANYYTPSGVSIHEIGIYPDVEVIADEDYTDEELDAYGRFLKESYIKDWLEAVPEYTKENVIAFADTYSEYGVPHDLLCYLMRNEYIYSLPYDERPVADLNFDTQLLRAMEIVKSDRHEHSETEEEGSAEEIDPTKPLAVLID